MSARDRKAIEDHGAAIGQILAQAVPKGLGFSLILFEFGEKGWLTYLSNGDRADTIKVLQELLGQLLAEQARSELS